MEKSAKEPLTIRDIARRARVSTATVSRVLNGASGVLPATQSAVLEVVRLTAYSPNPYAVELARNRRRKRVTAGNSSGTSGALIRARLDTSAD